MKKYSELYVPSLNDLKTKKDNSFIYVNNQGKISVAENLLLNPDNFEITKDNSNYNISTIALAAIDLLVVGGGGGSAGGAGGGAGGYIRIDSYPLQQVVTTQQVTIGQGGTPGTSNTSLAGHGGNTIAFGYTAVGGGRGGSYGNSSTSTNYMRNGGNGGSGGGANVLVNINNGVSGVSNANYTDINGNVIAQGFRGGSAASPNGNRPGAGGGGGAGGIGGQGTTGQYYKGGVGGVGKQWLDSIYYAGGGNGYKQTSTFARRTHHQSNGATNSGSGAGSERKYGGSGIVAIRYSKLLNINYTFTGTSTHDTTSSTTHDFIYLKSNGDLTLTYLDAPSNLNLKNANINITSESEFEEIRTEKIYDQGNSYKLKGVITETASGKPLFDTHGSVKLIKNSTNSNLRITQLNKGIFSPDAADHAWKSWADRHDSSYTTIQNLKGKIGNLNFDTHAASTSEKNTLVETDLTNSAIYSLGSPGVNTFRDLTWHSVLNGYLADTFANFVGDGSTNLGTHLGINTSDLSRFKRKNIYYFVQFTGLSKMNVTLPNPVNSDGILMYPKGSVISIFLRKHANNPTTLQNNRYVDFYVSDGTKLTLSDLTSLGFGYYHYPYYYALPDSENIEISIPTSTLYEGWFKFDLISMRDDNNNLQDTWKFIKSGFA